MISPCYRQSVLSHQLLVVRINRPWCYHIFLTKTKDDREHDLNAGFIGLIDHQKPNKLYLFTITEEHKKGANHVIEAIHRLFNNRTTFGALPPTL